MPSASPRNSARVASVVISGGNPTRVMNRPLNSPHARADEHGHGDGEPERQAPVLPGDAENDGREADDRADGEVDAAGDDDQRHRQRDERDLGRQPALVEQVLRIEELIRQQRHEDHAHHQDDEQDRLLAKQQATQPSR